MQKRYKVIEIESGCDCGECEDTSVFVVVEESVTAKRLMNGDADVLCDCYSQEDADFIVSAINRLVMN